MGKWNRRYPPRYKSRNYDYEDPPLSPPTPFNNCSGAEDSGVPSWEIDYCNSVRVPWRKISASKKYIYCYPNVLNWDASAGKEALENAKQRYWAMINGHPCDNPLPDPNLYIDEIDWNPYMDPELMADLELQAFDPDKAEKVEMLETIKEESEWDQAKTNKNQTDNPWERTDLQNSKDVGWSRWEDSEHPKSGNPWEQSCSQVVDSVKDSGWRSWNDSWGNWADNNANKMSLRQEEWGQGKNNSWSSFRNSKDEGLRSSGNYGYSSGNNNSAKERDWRDNRNKSWAWRESEYKVNNEPNYSNSRGFSRGERSCRGGCRKRENSVQHSSNNKSSRYHVDTYRDSRGW